MLGSALKRSGQVAVAAAAAAVAAITISATTFDPNAQPYRASPPLAITGFDITQGTQTAFQTWFNPISTEWNGELTAYAVSASGQVDMGTFKWKATEQLAADNCAGGAWQDTRRIVTRNGTGVPFRWASLSATQQGNLGSQNVLNYVRGDPTNEKQLQDIAGDGTVQGVFNPCSSPSGTLRGRMKLLGDIINGRPIYVGTPAANWGFDNYANFKQANVSRAGRVYVGANDGMLHAFDAATGKEVFAYVPSMVIPNLSKLTVTPYVHQYFVDGGTAVGDANFGSSGAPSWKTILVGGLGAGGRGLYALDVTDPAAADETAAAAKVLWEITNASTGFGDLGYTYADPAIARLNNGKWAVIVGNGLNNTGTGKSVLYFIDITNGSLIKSMSVGAGTVASPGGLSSPRVIDTNNDGKIDRVYAGDVDGKLWTFDIGNADPAQWAGSELHDAGMPILGKPDVAQHPNGGLMVFFGTGRLFTAADAADKTLQNYAYGIWHGAPADNTAVLEQTLITTDAKYGANEFSVRTSSSLPINYSDPQKTLHKGWRVKLPLGEHMVTSGFVRDNRFHFTSYNPSYKNPSKPDEPPGDNWLMELDFLNGTVSQATSDPSPIFDLLADQQLNDQDRVQDASGDPVAGPSGIPIGLRLGGGLFSEPLLALVSADRAVTMFNRNVLPIETPPTGCVTNCGGGVAGGHFDYDVYANQGASFKHTHEYDDKYDVTGASFTSSSDPRYNLVNPVGGPSKVVPAGQPGASKFFMLVSNGDLSPGVTITMGNKPYKAFEYPNKTIIADVVKNGAGSQFVFDSNTVKKFLWNMPVDGLTPKDWGQTPAVVRPGLIPTVTGCVRTGTKLGLWGENNNGALTFWIVEFKPGTNYDPDAGSSVISYNVPASMVGAGKLTAQDRENKGFIVIDNQYHLVRWTVFWHSTVGCYGDPGHSPNGKMDTGTSKPGVRPPGSEDPSSSGGGGPLPEVKDTTVTTTYNNPGNPKDLSGTRVTVTTFVDGSQLIVTETLKKDGSVDKKKTTTQNKPAPPGGGTPGGSQLGGSTIVAPPSELRNQGKLGRVSWHELIRD